MLWQVLTTPLTAYNQYSLTYYVGHRLDHTSANYYVRLYAGTTLLVEDYNNISSIPAGQFVQSTLNYFAGPTDPLLGQLLKIEMTSDLQANFDNFQLTATVVPEPGTLLLLGSGFLGLGIIGYFRKKRA